MSNKPFGIDVTLLSMSLGQKLHQLRKERDLTQDEVGKAAGVYKSQVSNWEKDKEKPSIDSIIALAKFFCVSTDYLLFDNVPREGVEAINDFELYEYFRKTESLPKEVKQSIKEIVDAVVLKYRINQMPESKSAASDQTTPLRKLAGKR